MGGGFIGLTQGLLGLGQVHWARLTVELLGLGQAGEVLSPGYPANPANVVYLVFLRF